MSELKHPNTQPVRLLAVIALSAFLISIVSLFRPLAHPQIGLDNVSTPESTLDKIQRKKVMRVGYGGFPPYTIVNPNDPNPNTRVSGFAVDIVNEIASRHQPPLEVEWEDLAWETFRADMLSGRFDFLADAVYYTVPKSSEFGMTVPYSFFGIGAAVVRIDDNRFESFEDLDRDDIVIALAQGYVSTELAQRALQKPELKILTVGDTAFPQLDEVLLGRADVALNDIPTVLQYVRAHPNEVKALWVNSPPSRVAAGFVTQMDDRDLRDFLNDSLMILQLDGTIGRIDSKWGGLGFYEEKQYKPGAGLESSSE